MSRAAAILIAGMHRSGTSALAGALGMLGVPLGSRLLEPGPDNPKGYWEHRDIVVVHERLLAALGSRWDDVRALPDGWLSSEPGRRAAAALADIVARDFAGKPLWAVKDPRICRFLPLWYEVLGNAGIRPTVLFMVRDPAEVSASIAARNQWASPIGEILWLRYMTEALEDSHNMSRSAISYDALLISPIDAVSRVVTRLGLHLDHLPSDAQATLERFVDVADRHHVHRKDDLPLTGFAAVAGQVYAALADIARGADDWLPAARAAAGFELEWQRHSPALSALAGMADKLSVDLQDALVDAARAKSALTAQIRWSEQAVQKQEALQAENAELASKLTAQIQWSEQAAEQCAALQAENAELASKLAAQIQWSEQAVRKHEALQAARDDLSSRLAQHEVDLATVTQELGASNSVRSDLSAKLAALRVRCAGLEDELYAMHASRSWRLTQPFRTVARAFGASPVSSGNDKRDSE